MTVRSTIDASRKAPKLASLELNRETIQELTASEAEDVVGGRPIGPRTKGNGCSLSCANTSGGCESLCVCLLTLGGRCLSLKSACCPITSV
jgi:hypothetical protein